MRMRRTQITSAKQLSRDDIKPVLDRAAEFAADPTAHTDRWPSALLGLAFFEPSTRTQMSFAAAIKRLGGDIVDMGGVDTSSVTAVPARKPTASAVGGSAYTETNKPPPTALLTHRHRDKQLILASRYCETDGVGHNSDCSGLPRRA